jgi:hypothetical protein
MEISLGVFDSQEEAMLAAETEDALTGGTEPLEWHSAPTYTSQPAPGHEYNITGPIHDRWIVIYIGPMATWAREYPSEQEAQDACEKHWDEIEPR